MLTASDGENSPALETVIQEEIQARPDDVKLRVRREVVVMQLFTSLQFAGTPGDALPADRQNPGGLQPLRGAGALPPLVLLPGVVLRPGRGRGELPGHESFLIVM